MVEICTPVDRWTHRVRMRSKVRAVVARFMLLLVLTAEPPTTADS